MIKKKSKNVHFQLYFSTLKITDRYDMTSSDYHGLKAIMKQKEEAMKTDIVVLLNFFDPAG